MTFIVNPLVGEELLIYPPFIAATLAVAEVVAERARELAPVGTAAEGDPHPGALRDSITAARGEGHVVAEVQAGDQTGREPASNAVTQEFGSSEDTAQPYLRPAAEGFGELAPA